MGLGEALLYYGGRYILYGVIALLGIFAGIRLRKRKNQKVNSTKESER